MAVGWTWSLVSAAVLIAVCYPIASVAVARFREWAVQRRILDLPNSRSLHTGAVPRGGGLAIVGLTLGAVVIGGVVGVIASSRVLWAYVLGALLVAGVSWADDLRGLPASVRFAAHAFAAALVVWSVGGFHAIAVPFAGTIDLAGIAPVIATAWIVGLTNAFNFMDGSDGIAGLQAIVAAMGWVVMAAVAHDPLIMVIGAAIVGSSAGFLRRNWSPAQVFMGDVGSAFLGYTFAAMTVIAAARDPRYAVAGVLAVWPFVFDTAFTLVQRLRRRERVWEAHRSHLYQRSIAVGARHATIALEYGAGAVVGVIAAWLWILERDDRGVFVIGAAAAVALGLWLKATVRERRSSMTMAPHA
jgi:UDP-N-acetylmuramyl pentapeptide phosphotransferase/UDP-N-acetylglucosamine-1-phosphate transferase